MKKIFSILVAAAALCAVACTNKGTEEASLSVDPKSIEFPAENAPATDVTVTAVGVKWEISVAETASGWLTAEKVNDKTVTVTATDNTTADQRVGSVIITSDDKVVGNREITVVQAGSENPVVYDLQLSSSLLEFEPESAEAQTVTVTVSGEMGWKAEAAEGCAEWVTVTAAADSFTVKVGDNPDTKERIGTVVVTADNESVEPKEVTIKQKPKVLPPSMSINVEDPETGVKFKANGQAYGLQDIKVTAVNTDWNAEVKDAEGNRPDWLSIAVNKDYGLSLISLTAEKNETVEERIAYVLITAEEESVADIKVTVTQDAAPEHFSTLSGNIDVSDLKYGYAEVTPNQEWSEPDEASSWLVCLYSDGVEENNGTFTGTGTYIKLEMASTYMGFNDADEYYLTDGTYNVCQYVDLGDKSPQMTYKEGHPGYYDWQHMGSWVFVMENDAIIEKGPFVTGTIDVSRNGNEYTFVFNLQDDMEYTITGTVTLEFSRVKRNSMPVPPPPVMG